MAVDVESFEKSLDFSSENFLLCHCIFRHPELPLLLRRKRIETQKAFYPMEVCIILDNQRVKGDQQDRDQIAV